MAGRRRRSGEGRMDAAVDHFAPMGYNKADVRKIVNGLLKDVYGKKGWALLEDNCYHVVQEALFEKQEQEEKLQLEQQQQHEEEAQHVQEEQQHQEEEVEEEWEADDEDQHAQEHEQQQEDDENQQHEAGMTGAPSENDMPIVEVHDEVPCEVVLAVEQTEEEVDPMIIDPASPETASPHPAATGSGRTRRPCYGWISESESDSDYEEFLASHNSSCMSRVQEETFLKGSGSVGGM